MPPSRRSAVVRGFSAASLAIFVALAAHVSSGGQMPGPLGILVPWVLSLMVCILLAGRKLSVIRLSASVAVSQFLFHVLFVLGAISPSGTVAPHVHGAPLQLPAGASAGEAIAADPTMWLGHLVAALVTIVALHRGERMLLRLAALAAEVVAWMRRRLGLVVFTQRPLTSTAVSALRAEDDALPADPILSTLRRRGPPALVAF